MYNLTFSFTLIRVYVNNNNFGNNNLETTSALVHQSSIHCWWSKILLSFPELSIDNHSETNINYHSTDVIF